ncbi:MAG TPA: DedA family protein [Dehalococcoidia bacterium]|nr:DedA family protein [Dehalococcoidia bacterium]
MGEVRLPLFGIENALLEAATHIYEAISWPGVVFLMAVESAAIPFPSEIIMPLAGWILVKDAGHGEEWLLLAALYGALGNTIGSVLAYYAGAWGGRPLLERYGRYVLVTPRELDTADRWFQRYGEPAVFVSRLLPVVRTFISVPAGVARMNVWRFAALTFIGSYVWSLALAWGGFLLGEHWERLTHWLRPVAFPIAFAVLFLVAYYFYRRFRELSRDAVTIAARDEPAGPAPNRDPAGPP